MTPKFRTILITVLATLLTVLILQNLRGTSVRFIVWDVGMPLSLLVILAFGLGWAMHWFWRGR